jgi:copper(I)-binding protein
MWIRQVRKEVIVAFHHGAARRAWMWALGTALWGLAACGGSGPAVDESSLQVTLLPPAEGMAGETMTVRVLDAEGAPVTDATVSLEGNMNHAGMVPVLAEGVTDNADGSADGLYRLPFTITMLGDWIISVTVERPDGVTVTRNIEMQVNEDGISVEDEPVEEASAGGLHVRDVVVRAVPVAGGNGALYLTVVNGTTADEQLLGASSPSVEVIELHETVQDNGVMRMVSHPEGFVIPPGGALTLEPGGKHLMLVNMADVASGGTVEVTLQFAEAGEVTVSAPVVGPGETVAAEEHDH